MQVHRIANQQSFGMAFKVTKTGASKLANDFVNSPHLEAEFMKKIVAPLDKAEASVVYNGYSAVYKHNADEYYSSIVHSSPSEIVTMPLGGPLAYSRTGYRPKDGSTFKLTNDFRNSEYSNIEAAKNMALNIVAERSGKSLDTYIPKDYKAPNLGKTFEEKVSNIMKFFGLE